MNAIFKHVDVTREIINAAYKVHNSLGCGFLEKVYENAICLELKLKGLKVEKEKKVIIRYRDSIVGEYFADIVVEGKVIVELKNVEKIASVHKAQILNYLRASGIEVGLIMNFSKPRLEIQRLVI